MICLGKHVKWFGLPDPVACVAENGQVTGEGGGIAGNVGNGRWCEAHQQRVRFTAAPGPWRIDHHRVTRFELDERDAHAKMLAEKAGTKMLSSGTISLQSESHPIDFRKVELKILKE